MNPMGEFELKVLLSNKFVHPLMFLTFLSLKNVAEYECEWFLVPGLTGTKMSASDEVSC